MIERLVAAMVLLAVAGCGSGSSGSPDRTRTLASLSLPEQQRFCDEFSGLVGGYGAQLTCPDGSMPGADPNQGSCVIAVEKLGAACPALLVSNVLDCFADLCDLETGDVCAAFRTCLALASP